MVKKSFRQSKVNDYLFDNNTTSGHVCVFLIIVLPRQEKALL